MIRRVLGLIVLFVFVDLAFSLEGGVKTQTCTVICFPIKFKVLVSFYEQENQNNATEGNHQPCNVSISCLHEEQKVILSFDLEEVKSFLISDFTTSYEASMSSTANEHQNDPISSSKTNAIRSHEEPRNILFKFRHEALQGKLEISSLFFAKSQSNNAAQILLSAEDWLKNSVHHKLRSRQRPRCISENYVHMISLLALLDGLELHFTCELISAQDGSIIGGILNHPHGRFRRKLNDNESNISDSTLAIILGIFGMVLVVLIVVILYLLRTDSPKCQALIIHRIERPIGTRKRRSTAGWTEIGTQVTKQLAHYKVVPFSDLKLGKELGCGTFGVVYKATFLQNSKVAVKRLYAWNTSKDQKELLNEILVLRLFKHPNIVMYYGVTTMPSSVGIQDEALNVRLDSTRNSSHEGMDIGVIYEYMAFGNLSEFIDLYKNDCNHNHHGNSNSNSANEQNYSRCKRKMKNELAERFNWQDLKLSITADILAGLMFLHYFSPQLYHLNLKSRNVLLNHSFQAKLINFNASQEIFSQHKNKHKHKNNEKVYSKLSSFCSTTTTTTTTTTNSHLFPLPPEVILHKKVTEKTDVFSFGVILRELITHQDSYSQVLEQDNKRIPNIQSVYQIFCNKLRPPTVELPSPPRPCPQPILDLYEQCIKDNPSDRPSVTHCLDVITNVYYKRIP